MDSEHQEMSFQEVDRRYAELKRQYAASALNDEEFDAQLKQMMVQDDKGYWWAKGRRTGDWYYYDGVAYVKGKPPKPGGPRRWITMTASLAALVVIIVAFLGLIAYVGSEQGAGEPPNPGEGQAVGQSQNSGYVFKDDFSETAWWDQTRENPYGNYYDEGRYRMYTKLESGQGTRWSIAHASTPGKDVIVEVNATRTGDAPSDPSSNWGIMCRTNSSNDGNGYLMGVSDAGYPIIQRLQDGTLTTLAQKPSYDGYAVQKDEATNHIRGDCEGSKLTLYVNDSKLLEVDDSELGSGNVGLYVQNRGYEPPGTDVSFDDFWVSKS